MATGAVTMKTAALTSTTASARRRSPRPAGSVDRNTWRSSANSRAMPLPEASYLVLTLTPADYVSRPDVGRPHEKRFPLLQADSQSGGAAPTLTIARQPDSGGPERHDRVQAAVRNVGLGGSSCTTFCAVVDALHILALLLSVT